jgi:hypothetical protein
MKKIRCLRYGTALGLLMITCPARPISLYGTSFLLPRSQSTNAARDIVGMHRYIDPFGHKGFFGAATVTPEYMRTFRPYRLAQYFFNTDELIISGSELADRSDDNILADYFGLAQEFDSNVRVKPILRNVLIDFAFYGGYNNWYFRAHAPLTWASAEICLGEVVRENGLAVPYPTGYMAADPVTAPYARFKEAIQGTQSFGEVERLQFGKIPCRALTQLALSDIQAVVGYNLVSHSYGYAGLNARFSIPTGTRPNGEFLLAPTIGNGKHWEFGFGFSGDVLVWEKDGEQQLRFCVDANLTHLCNARQQRSFDFKCNGFGSRYVLLKEFDSNGVYTGRSLPAINVSSVRCTINIAIQVDAVIMFAYQYNNFSFDIGYNAWLRSHERISCVDDPFATHNFAFKGIQNVINPDTSTNSTQSTATLFGNIFADQALVADPNPPVFIEANSLDICSAAAPLAFTNKIFWGGSYQWPRAYWSSTPFICIGGEVEFEGVRPKWVQANKVAVSQWGAFAKAGLAW